MFFLLTIPKLDFIFGLNIRVSMIYNRIRGFISLLNDSEKTNLNILYKYRENFQFSKAVESLTGNKTIS